MLRFEGVTKTFGWRQVFKDLRHEFEPGVHALQGPNGIGKSTLLAILAGAMEPDSGDIWIDGFHLRSQPLAARKRLSYVPDESPIYPFMTGSDLLDFVAMAKNVPLGQDILSRAKAFGLGSYLQARFSTMSLGTQKKCMLAAAWIGEPRVMLLDEPSNGLDAHARELLAHDLREQGREHLVLLSTHDMGFVASCGAAVFTMDVLQAHPVSPAG